MNSNKKAAGTVLDGRIILAALWVAEVLSSLNGDTYRMADPATIKAILANTSAIAATPELLTVMSFIFVVPVLMSVMTLILKHPASRKMNRIVGILYAVVLLAFFILLFVMQSAGYEFVWAASQLVFVLLVVWFAWRRPEQEA